MEKRNTNKLINEKSPYLLQHAHNPVDWYPWGEEAFEKARLADKPVFLSIGYSTCHWCHVMENESFEDMEVASALNAGFVSIKVDKEERPDIDSVYMSVCQALTGQGGWPMTIIMNHDQKPFFAGTYFPKHSRYGMPGLLNILDTVAQKWSSDRETLLSSSEEIARIVGENSAPKFDDGGIRKEIIHAAKGIFEDIFDHRYGGFGKSPKFPTPHNLMLLLRYSILEKDDTALKMVEKTLQQMYKGGIFDHVGGGFSRYSTDIKWLAPHFEKMLYDNALLAIVYLEAYQHTGNSLYQSVAVKTLQYILREMTSSQGGFYCAQDADSEGEEGKFYVFTAAEIIDLLGDEDAALFSAHFGITNEGNFEGKNIPNLIDTKNYHQKDEHLEELCKKLYDYRLSRMSLHKDDKILTSWNALMIVAFAKAYKILGDNQYLMAAQNAIDFIENNLTDGKGGLMVRFRDGHKAGIGHLDDYAFYIWALTEVYQADFCPRYLKMALEYKDKMLAGFWDNSGGGFFYTDKEGERLIFRPKETYDGAMPSGNSVAAYVLIMLAKLTGDPSLEEEAHRQLKFVCAQGQKNPAGHSFALIATMAALYPTKEVVCVAADKEGEEAFKKLIRKRFLPQVYSVLKNSENAQEIEKLVRFLKSYELVDGKTAYFLCENNSCSAPVTSVEKFTEKLSGQI